MTETTNGTLLKEREIAGVNGNGMHPLVPTDELAIAKLTTNKQLIEERKVFSKGRDRHRNKYHGIRGYLRLFQISRVIAMLSLYLYLDQYDVHHKHNLKKAAARMETAENLTRAAVYGEKLYAIRSWFFHTFMRLMRRFFVGSSTSKEANQQKQAVWLKDKLDNARPDIYQDRTVDGHAGGPFAAAICQRTGTLVDQVPPFPNDVAFARIEHELGRKINDGVLRI